MPQQPAPAAPATPTVFFEERSDGPPDIQIRGKPGDKILMRNLDKFAAPIDADLSYVTPDLRFLAVRCDSLVLDLHNVKDHGDRDIPKHQASLRQFGIRRAVFVRRKNRQVEAGNGTVMAALANGWEYVPVAWADDDQETARAFSFADNAVGTLASWNPEILEEFIQESSGLFINEVLLQEIAADVQANLAALEDATAVEVNEASIVAGEVGANVTLSRRIIAVCKDEPAQIELLKELADRGFECRLSTVRVK